MPDSPIPETEPLDDECRHIWGHEVQAPTTIMRCVECGCSPSEANANATIASLKAALEEAERERDELRVSVIYAAKMAVNILTDAREVVVLEAKLRAAEAERDAAVVAPSVFIPVAQLYVAAFFEDEMMTATEKLRLQEIEATPAALNGEGT